MDEEGISLLTLSFHKESKLRQLLEETTVAGISSMMFLFFCSYVHGQVSFLYLIFAWSSSFIQ